MFIGIKLELQDGQKSRSRFTQTTESGAIVHWDAARGCFREITPEHVAVSFGVIDFDYDGDARMERDSLGIAFKLFEALPVPIPRAVQDHYGIDVRREPLGRVPLDGKPF